MSYGGDFGVTYREFGTGNRDLEIPPKEFPDTVHVCRGPRGVHSRPIKLGGNRDGFRDMHQRRVRSADLGVCGKSIPKVFQKYSKILEYIASIPNLFQNFGIHCQEMMPARVLGSHKGSPGGPWITQCSFTL